MFAALGINLDIIIYVLIGIIVVLAATLIISLCNLSKLRRIMKNCSSGKLDETIVEYYDKVEALTEQIAAQSERFVKYENNLALCAQKIGCIRYNAFADTGSDLSYSIAVLDEKDSGFVLTGIFGRDNSNTYLKPIVEGQCRITLSEEEMSAIAQAKENYRTKHMD